MIEKMFTAEGNPYIHLTYANSGVPSMYGLFSKERTKKVYESQMAKLKTHVQNTYIPPDGEDIFEYLDLVKEGLESEFTEKNIMQGIATSAKVATFKNVFSPNAAKQMELSLSAISQYGTNAHLFGKINGKMENLSTYIAEIDKIIKETKIEFDDDKIQEFVENFFLEQGGRPKGSSKVFNAALTDFLNKNDHTLIARSNIKVQKGSTDFLRYAARLKATMEVLRRLESKNGLANSKEGKRFYQGCAYNVSLLVSQVGGFLFEAIVPEVVTMASTGVLASISAIGGGSGKVEVQMTAEEKKKLNTQKVVRKADTLFTYNSNQNGISSSIAIDLPGASLKGFTPNSKKQVKEIKIQSETTFNDIFVRGGIGGTIEEYAIVNMLSSYRRVNQKFTNKEPMVNMYNYIHSKNILNALVGTLAKDDTAYFFIVNEKVFKSLDIIKSLANQSADMFLTMNMSPSQTAIKDMNKLIQTSAEESVDADSRSNILYAQIKNTKVSTALNMNNKLFK